MVLSLFLNKEMNRIYAVFRFNQISCRSDSPILIPTAFLHCYMSEEVEFIDE